ncbi:MAG: response regulator [Verrucomicrobiota bacterium]
MSQLKFQVLLLSLDAKLAETLSSLIRLDGGTAGRVTTCAEALHFTQNHPPDLILLDVKTTEAESLNLVRHFKSSPPALPAYTIMMAPTGDNSAVLRAFDMGLNEFIQTPFESSLFRARLRGAVHLKRRLEELFRRQQELIEACQAAEANSRAKSDFLATMSHEIRTPMNGVVAMTGLMMETPLTPEQRGYLETIYNSSESLLKIINNILDFSKIEADKMELEKREFNLGANIEEALDLMAARAFEKKLDLGYELDPMIPAVVEGDAQRLSQVLVNLLSNALKFTEKGGVFIQAEKTQRPAGEPENASNLWLHFMVRDTGIGIEPDRLTRLFRAFMQADASTSRQYGGTGLGLAISRRLVEMMGGRMWVESKPDAGSTFHFTVTMTASPAAQPPAHSMRMPRLAGLKILILDDSATCRNTLSEQSRRWGMQPKSAENAAQAMEWIRTGETFDLALIDADLPGKDGFTVAAEIQKITAAAMLPIVLMIPLGKNHENEMAKVVFAHMVSKPVKPAQLCAVLERALLSPRIPTRLPESPKTDLPLATRLPLRILLVDDNAINLKVAVRILQQMGYEPDTATNGGEALKALDRKPIDLIFMDVMMPEMDGLEATRQLRKRQVSGRQTCYPPQIIVVAMTAHAMQGDREKCLAAGMDDYLSKPVRPKDIREMIERWAGKIMQEMKPAAPAAAGPPEEEPPVNMDRMNDLTDGNMDNLRELAEMFLKQTTKQFAQIEAAIREGNADTIQRVAHSCAGASATLGMTRLAPKLRELEKLGGAGTLTNAGRICEDAAREYDRIREFLKAQPELTACVTGLTLA